MSTSASAPPAATPTAQPPQPPPPMTNLPGISVTALSPATQSFTTVLQQYRTAMAYYKLTGNSAIKPQVDRYKQWLDSYVAALKDQGNQQTSKIQAFVGDYQKANPELVEMQRQMKAIQTEGPKLQDQYETELAAQVEEPVDYTDRYVKAGLIAGLLGVVAVLAVF